MSSVPESEVSVSVMSQTCTDDECSADVVHPKEEYGDEQGVLDPNGAEQVSTFRTES